MLRHIPALAPSETGLATALCPIPTAGKRSNSNLGEPEFGSPVRVDVVVRGREADYLTAVQSYSYVVSRIP